MKKIFRTMFLKKIQIWRKNFFQIFFSNLFLLSMSLVTPKNSTDFLQNLLRTSNFLEKRWEKLTVLVTDSLVFYRVLCVFSPRVLASSFL